VHNAELGIAASRAWAATSGCGATDIVNERAGVDDFRDTVKVPGRSGLGDDV